MSSTYHKGLQFKGFVDQIRPTTPTNTPLFPILDPQSDPIVTITYSPGGVVPQLQQYLGEFVEFRIQNKHLSLRNKEVHNNRLWGGNFHTYPEIERTLPLTQRSLIELTNNSYPQHDAIERPQICTTSTPPSIPSASKPCFCCLKRPEPLINPLTNLSSELKPYPTVQVDTSTTQYLLENQPRRYIRYHQGDHFYTDDSDIVAMLQHSGALTLTLSLPTFQGLSVICRVLPALPFYPSTELYHTKYRSRALNGPYFGHTLQIVRTEHFFNPLAPYPSRSAIFPNLPSVLELTLQDGSSDSESTRTASNPYYSHPLLTTATEHINHAALNLVYDDTRTNSTTMLKMAGGEKLQTKISLRRQLTDDIMGFSSMQSDCLYLSYQHGLAILNRYAYTPPIAFPTQSGLNPFLNSAFNTSTLTTSPSPQQITQQGLKKALLTMTHPFPQLFTLPTTTPLSPYDLPTSFQLLQYNLEIITRCCIYIIQVTGTTPLRLRQPPSLTTAELPTTQSIPSDEVVVESRDKKRQKRSKDKTQHDADQELVSLTDSAMYPAPTNTSQFELLFSISSVAPKPEVPYVFTALRLFHLRHLHTLFQHLPIPPEFESTSAGKDVLPQSTVALSQAVTSLLAALPDQSQLDSSSILPFPDVALLQRVQANPLTLPFSDPDVSLTISDRHKQYALEKFPGLSIKQSKILASFVCLYMKQNKPTKYEHIHKSHTFEKTVALTCDVLGAVVDYFTYHHDARVLAHNLTWDDFIWTEDNLIVRNQLEHKETTRILGIRFMLK